ncbi:tyrosine--tRNA ligase [Flavobacteriaceae bacterium]|nr:tyrosine--tRNA ligase [Flavobacteriaceae bacterium]MDC0106348.1 tyrosine--tRNA ligase [Flavobacteriaceae bacterium]MDC0593701.1 tyrosine--tRNA ligase [Flavobacteriaceae bacterium]
MSKNFIKELEWRGMLQDSIPGCEDQLLEKSCSGYIGFDPTADSLHIGSLVQILILMHFQKCGHKPIVLVGGATGMIGDPSGKSNERNLLSQDDLDKNIKGIHKQLSKFLNFDSDNKNSAVLCNNNDWFQDINLIDFIRDTGKYITVNYMIAKESVKKRLSKDSTVGMSFTEFSYQLIQAYDFYHLFSKKNCLIQMGGSDQWGNITSGVELIRKKSGEKAYALTCPLITKADGTKFGKTEDGNVWLDRDKTSPYKFYQYWLNISDADAKKYIKIFTFYSIDDINEFIQKHDEAPHQRFLQNTIAEFLTKLVHSDVDLKNSITASNILFGKSTSEDLNNLDEKTFLDIFEGVPSINISFKEIEKSSSVQDFLHNAEFLSSKSEIIRALKQNSISINKEKVDSSYVISKENLICEKYILAQRGKKNYYLISFN